MVSTEPHVNISYLDLRIYFCYILSRNVSYIQKQIFKNPSIIYKELSLVPLNNLNIIFLVAEMIY